MLRTKDAEPMWCPWRLMLVTLTLALAGGVAQTALAAPAGGPSPAMGPGWHGMPPGLPPGMQGGMLPGPGMHRGQARLLGHLLDLAQATPEQRSQIQQIMQAARRDLQGQREAGRTLRLQQQALLTQATVDAAAVESLRQQMLALHDLASKRITQALLEASGVLTPEQRRRIGEHRAMLERHRAERQALESRN